MRKRIPNTHRQNAPPKMHSAAPPMIDVYKRQAKNCAASTLATSEYSIPVTGAVRQGLVYGTQFHPEKSGDTGLRLLKAFAEL